VGNASHHICISWSKSFVTLLMVSLIIIFQTNLGQFHQTMGVKHKSTSKWYFPKKGSLSTTKLHPTLLVHTVKSNTQLYV